MVAVPGENVERTFRSYIEQWVRAVAQSDWAGAVGMLDEPNSYGVRWSESEIQNALEAYSPGAKVSNPANLKNGSPRISLGKFDDGSGYWFDYSIPINGDWSDLTAQFAFKRRGNGYAVILDDIHVL